VTDAGSAKHGRVGVGCIALFALFLLGPLDNPQKSQNPVAIGVGVHHWGIAKSGMSSLIGIDPLKRSPSAIQRLPFPPRDKSTKSVKRRDRLIHVMSPRLTSLATNPVPLVQMNPHLQNNAAEIMSGLLPSLPNHVLPGSPSAKDGTNQTADNARSYGISHKSWKELATGALILFVVAVLWKIIEAWIVSRQVDEMVRLMKDIGEQRKSYISANVPDELSLLASGTKACSAGDVPEVPKGQGLAPSACSADFFEELSEALRILGAKSDLLGTIGSVGETISDEEAVECLRAWNRTNRHRKS